MGVIAILQGCRLCSMLKTHLSNGLSCHNPWNHPRALNRHRVCSGFRMLHCLGKKITHPPLKGRQTPADALPGPRGRFRTELPLGGLPRARQSRGPKGTFCEVLSPSAEKTAPLICLAACVQKVLLTANLILFYSNANSFVFLIFSIKMKAFTVASTFSNDSRVRTGSDSLPLHDQCVLTFIHFAKGRTAMLLTEPMCK